MKQKLILLALVISLTIVSQSSFSLGMGKIQVYSALNEPLQSSIDLLANADEELLNLEVKLASSEDYQKVGLDKSFVPGNIMVAFDKENPYQINVMSNGPVTEPIVSLLLDVNWSNGRILREFTVLLDPPIYESINTNAQVNNVVVEPIVENTVTEMVVEEPVMSNPDPEPELQPREEETTTYTNEDLAVYDDVETTEEVLEPTPVYSSSSVAEVVVETGDTLWRIANNNKVGNLSTQQMMMAIYNKNPNAFSSNNINQLIKGSRLDMPSNDEATTVGFSEALAQVESHHQSWSSAQQDYSTYQTEEADEIVYPEPETTLDYGVQLSGGDNEGSDGGQSNADEGTAAEAQAIEEDLYNQSAENTDLKERISELEDIVEQQQDVIEISDDGLANLENQLENTGNEASQVVDDAIDDVGDTAAEVADDIWGEASDTVDEAAGEFSVNVDAVDATTDSDSNELLAGDSDTTDENTNDESVIDAEVTDIDPAEQTDAEVVPVVTQNVTSVKQESLVDKSINWVMDNLMWVLIGLVTLIMLLFLPKALRSNDDEAETSFLDDIKTRKNSNEEDAIDAVDTKMDQPLEDDFEEDVVDAEDDVLAELDRSIDFEDVTNSEDLTTDDVSDELTELVEDNEFEVTDDDDFDLDGFLNDDDNDDITATKDHAATLADVSFDDDTSADVSFDDDTSETDLDFELNDDDELSLDDLNLDDEIEELADDAAEVVEDVKDEVEEVIDDAVEVVEDKVDEFSFDDDEDFDFDLDEELEELEQPEENDSTDSDEHETDVSEEFNDVLDISEDDTETFEIIDDEAGMDEEIDLGLEDLMDDADAIDTKLDLAKAYIDMGDAEGAKNLLEEIYSEGTEEQIAEAKKLLDDM